MGQDEATYLYCFARPGAADGLAAAAVDGRPGVAEVEVAGVVAVCSSVSLPDFEGGRRADGTPDPEWVIPRACRHECVVEEVMRRSPVLPVRFGALFSSRPALQLLLLRQGRTIADFLDEIDGNEEWAVKGYVDAERAGDWLLSSEPALASRRQALAASPGARYFQEKQLRAEVQRQVKSWGRTLAGEVRETFDGLALAFRALRLRQEREPGSPGEMVLHWAILLPRDGIAAFGDRLAAVRSRHEGRGLTLEPTGPWPPFHFCPELEGANG